MRAGASGVPCVCVCACAWRARARDCVCVLHARVCDRPCVVVVENPNTLQNPLLALLSVAAECRLRRPAALLVIHPPVHTSQAAVPRPDEQLQILVSHGAIHPQ